MRPDHMACAPTDGGSTQAFQELAKGERTATALENQLNTMEAKIEALLAQAERDQKDGEKMKAERSQPDNSDA